MSTRRPPLRHLPAGLALAVGLLGGPLLGWYLAEAQRDTLRLRFKQLTDSPREMVTQQIRHELDRLRDLRMALAFLPHRDDRAVQRYIDRFLKGANPVTILLLDFKGGAAPSTRPGTRPTQPGRGHGAETLSHAVHPEAHAEGFAFDRLHGPAMRAAMERALARNGETALVSAGGFGPRYGPGAVGVVAPVASFAMSFGDFSASPASSGFILAIYDLRALVDRALEPLDKPIRRAFTLKVIRHAATGPAPHGTDPSAAVIMRPGGGAPAEQETALQHRERVRILGMRLMLAFTATETFAARHRNPVPLLAAAAFAALGFLSSGYLFHQRRLQERIRRLADEDELTGLASRRSFLQVLEQQIAHAKRYERPLAFLLLDIDGFKAVNDTHGHQVGDEILARIGPRLRHVLRAADMPARYGGEEIGVALPEQDLEHAHRVAERVRVAIRSTPFGTSAGPLAVTASIGVSALRADDRTADLLHRVDRALYAAKVAGRDRVLSEADLPASP